MFTLEGVLGPTLIERRALEAHDAPVPRRVRVQHLALHAAEARLLHAQRRSAELLAQIHGQLGALDASAERRELEVIQSKARDLHVAAAVGRFDVRLEQAAVDGHRHRGLRGFEPGGSRRVRRGVLQVETQVLIRAAASIHAHALDARLHLPCQSRREQKLIHAQAFQRNLAAELRVVHAVRRGHVGVLGDVLDAVRGELPRRRARGGDRRGRRRGQRFRRRAARALDDTVHFGAPGETKTKAIGRRETREVILRHDQRREIQRAEHRVRGSLGERGASCGERFVDGTRRQRDFQGRVARLRGAAQLDRGRAHVRTHATPRDFQIPSHARVLDLP